MILRILSGLGGGAILLTSALITFGASLTAPVGMLLARRIAHRRGRTATRWTTWLGATSAAAITLALLLAVLLIRSPNIWREVLHNASVASADAARQPTWLDRTMPQATQRSNRTAERLFASPAFMTYIGILTAAFLSALYGAFAGTAGWAGALLLGFSFRRGSPAPTAAS